MSTHFRCGLLMLATFLPGLFFAQMEAGSPRTIFEYITQKEGSDLTLEADFSQILAQKKTAKTVNGKLITADSLSFVIEIRSRGRFRRMKAVTPPLKIEVAKAELAKHGLDSLDELKISMPVLEEEKGDELIVREYLAYKMFEKVAPFCNRARLVRLNMVNTNTDSPSKKKMYAILIEDEEEMARRLGCGAPVEAVDLPADSLDIKQAAITVMFEYMIGNTDWELPIFRNLRAYRHPQSGKVLAIPYDFDFAGLVSAPYSAPSSASGLLTVRERFLMPYDIPKEKLVEAVQALKAAEQDFYAMCRASFVPKAASKDMVEFLKSFFKEVEKDESAPWSTTKKK